MLTRESQPDTPGYNFVDELSGNTYLWIKNGDVVLWDSPEKKKVISLEALVKMQNSSQLLFTNVSDVYIYENWSADKKSFRLNVDGFSFTGVNIKGEEVLFGYIEYNKGLKELMEHTPMHINANGNYGITLNTAVMDMGFRYTLIYFDKSPLTDYKSIHNIVNAALAPGKINATFVPVKTSKQVEYGWDSTDAVQAGIKRDLMRAFYIFFNQNKQEFFNYGGDKYYSYLRDAPILISDVHVLETWTKESRGTLISPDYIVIYTAGIRLQPIPVEKMTEWNMRYKEKPLVDFLVAQDFPYQIKKINDSMIPAGVSESCKNALFAGNWYHVY